MATETIPPEERARLDGEVAALFEGEERYEEMSLLVTMINEAEYVADLAAYIRVAAKRKVPKIQIQFNVVHDIVQYGRECFVPRTKGYAKREKEA